MVVLKKDFWAEVLRKVKCVRVYHTIHVLYKVQASPKALLLKKYVMTMINHHGMFWSVLVVQGASHSHTLACNLKRDSFLFLQRFKAHTPKSSGVAIPRPHMGHVCHR